MSELAVLQAVRMKGRVSVADLAATVNEDPDRVTATVAELTTEGLLVEGKTLRISPPGRERLNALLAQERSAVDANAVLTAYEEFRGVNAEFKALVSDWQIKDGQPNAHDDADYDGAVLARLDGVHTRTAPVLAAIADQLPRLANYGDKLTTALARVKAGDRVWLARPIIDSYHTVWFELHEELIAASGLTREEEAKAGHAQ